MDDKYKKLTFMDFVTVDYTGTGDEYLAYQAQKRRRGHHDTFGEEVDNKKRVLERAMSKRKK